MNPIKVLQIGMTNNIGGMETYLMSQFLTMDYTKISYDFISFHKPGEMAFEELVRQNHSEIYCVPARRSNPIQHYIGIIKVIFTERNRYDAVVINTCDMMYVFPLLIAKLVGIRKRIIHSHNSGFEIHNNCFKSILLWINKKIVQFSYTDLWACSKAAGLWMFENKPFEIIHNAIDLKEFEYNIVVRNDMRDKLGIANKFVIGNVARFSYQKNHEFLIKMFAKLHKKKENAILLLIGDGIGSADGSKYYWERAHELVKNLGIESNVYFLGNRTDVKKLYQAMDCYVLPSHFEGLSVSAIEAQAAGLPCVFSNKISQETKVTNNVHFIGIEESSYDDWINTIISYASIVRTDTKCDLIRNGYDIRSEVLRVENLYKNDK